MASQAEQGRAWTAPVEGAMDFAVDLYRRLGGQADNVLCSPSCMRMALAMAGAGASGVTERQMAAALRLERASPARQDATGNVWAQWSAAPLDGDGTPAYELRVANALWAQRGYAIDKSYVDVVTSQYAGALREVDFAVPESAAEAINAWVADRTGGKIADIVDRAALSGVVRLVLANGVYFKSNWLMPFDRSLTRAGEFRLVCGDAVSAAFMQQQLPLRYLETPDFQAVEMPYRGGVLAMTVLLPTRVDGLAALERALTAARLREWREGMNHHEVRLSLPRFRFASGFCLSETLAEMGMAEAFDAAAADFSRITQAERFFLGCVFHKTFIAVDEEGTEAGAAATCLVAAAAAEEEPERPKIFTADRPFLFLIRHMPTGEALFLGRLADPTTE